MDRCAGNTDTTGNPYARNYGAWWWHNTWEASGRWHGESQRFFDDGGLFHSSSQLRGHV